jgi:hypothetical protein
VTRPAPAFDDPLATPDVTKPIGITGTASSDNLLRYTLEQSPHGKDEWVRFASGTTSATQGVLGRFDPTNLQNGFYDVRLTVEDTAGKMATAVKEHQADGHIKIGNFTLALMPKTMPSAPCPRARSASRCMTRKSASL